MDILKNDYSIIDTRLDCHDKIKKGLLHNILHMTQLEYGNSMLASNQGGYHSHYQSAQEFFAKEFKVLSDEIFSKSKPTLEYLEQRENALPYGFDIELWVNVNYKNDFNAIHNHTRTREGNLDKEVLISGIYYLTVPENSGRIIFPSELKFLKPFFKRNLDEVFEPEEGQLLLFYPHRFHAVESNLSEDYRVSIAFNLVAVHQK